ncbi:MAG TPA: hypothetical protein VNT32_07035 [Thermoleophilaceae bacterium]|nr:hypothetical protein [Thermoleophilaceae bacterium]
MRSPANDFHAAVGAGELSRALKIYEVTDTESLSQSGQTTWSYTLRQLADALAAAASEALAEEVDGLFETIGLARVMADHVVWSDYGAYHPRTLHLWPDGHRYGEESPHGWDNPHAYTICGLRVQLFDAPVERAWSRAYHGEWRRFAEARRRYRAEQWHLEQQNQADAHRWTASYEDARRICEVCFENDGLFVETGLATREQTPAIPPWHAPALQAGVVDELVAKLKGGRFPGREKAARATAEHSYRRAVREYAAQACKQAGPDILRRLFGDRERANRRLRRGPADPMTRYDELEALARRRAKRPPNELLSTRDWRKLIAAHSRRPAGTEGMARYEARTAFRAELDPLLVELAKAS